MIAAAEVAGMYVSLICMPRWSGVTAWFVIPDSSRPAAQLDMRPVVDGSPTEEADIDLGYLDRLTLARCTDDVEGLDHRPSIYMSLRAANDHVLATLFLQNPGDVPKVSGVGCSTTESVQQS